MILSAAFLPVGLLWRLFSWVAPFLLALNLLGYLLPHLIVSTLCCGRNLKRAYSAEWALVTGASSGVQTARIFCAISKIYVKMAP